MNTTSTHRYPRFALAAAGLAVAFLACRSNTSRTASDSARMDSMPAAATAPDSTAMAPNSTAVTPNPTAMAAVPTDAQIAQIVMTANSTDSSLGALAVSNAKSTSVKAFGRRMVRDHGTANKTLATVLSKASITPQDSPTSHLVQASADSASNSLAALSGSDFDRQYVDGQVTIHQNVLDQLDNTLIPNAQNPDLKSYLQQVRGTVSSHLTRAKQLQSTVGTSATKP